MIKSDELEYIEANGEQYPIAFNLNVNARLQNEYGTIQEWSSRIFPTEDSDDDKEPDFNALIKTFQIMLNEGIDIEGNKRDMITESQAGRLLTTVGTETMIEKIVDNNKEDSDEGADDEETEDKVTPSEN